MGKEGEQENRELGKKEAKAIHHLDQAFASWQEAKDLLKELGGRDLGPHPTGMIDGITEAIRHAFEKAKQKNKEPE